MIEFNRSLTFYCGNIQFWALNFLGFCGEVIDFDIKSTKRYCYNNIDFFCKTSDSVYGTCSNCYNSHKNFNVLKIDFIKTPEDLYKYLDNILFM